MNKPSSLSTHRLFHLSALPLFAVAGVLAGACGGSGSPSSGTGGSAATTTTSATTGSTTGTGGAGGSDTTSTTSTTGAGGSPQNPDPCDPIAQNCVEPVESKCVFRLDEASSATSTCEAPLGDKMLGEACQRPTNESGIDDCAKGLFCSGVGIPKSNPQERVCRTLCGENGTCGEGSECVALDADRTIGFCAARCDPFDAGACGGDPALNCYPLSVIEGGGGPTCHWVGTKDEGESCATPTDCKMGLTCHSAGAGAVCTHYCNDAHLCPDADGYCSAAGYNTWPLTPALGACHHADYACLGTVSYPDAAGAKASVQVVAFDAFTGDVVPGAMVKACAANDSTCAAPLAQGVTANDGSVSIDVPTPGKGFTGYLEVTAAGMMPALIYQSMPIGMPAVASAPLMAKANIETAIKGGATADPGRGVVVAFGYDCAGLGAGGASFKVSSADAQTVLAHGLPSTEYIGVHPDCFDPAAKSSQTGVAAALDVPAGMSTVSAEAPGAVSLASTPVTVRAGALTLVLLFPGP